MGPDVHERLFGWLEDSNVTESGLYFLGRLRASERLQNGYWFIGDDDTYLQTTFWDERDTKSKVYRIAFEITTINNNLTPRIQIVCRDNPERIPTFQNLANRLNCQECVNGNVWRKYYREDFDYIDAFNEFIITDVQIINTILGPNIRHVGIARHNRSMDLIRQYR